MDIKTKGFSMPDGNTHIFIPPAPTETDRGGITAKPRTTEAAEVVVDSGTGKGYIGTDHTLKAKGQAADSEAVGIAISEKADRIISSASGEDVILTDSAEAPLQGLRVFGKSEQVTTKGYQLFDASKLPSKSQGGATVTNNGDGSFTISGDGNLTEVFDLNFSYSSEDAKKIFKIGAINKSKNATNPIISYHVRYNGKTENLGNNITEEMYNANDFTIKCIFYGRKDSKVVGGIVKPMLYQEGDGTWEPFTGGKPSPSPDNPSPIKSVGDKGSVEVDVTGKNLCPGIKRGAYLVSNGSYSNQTDYQCTELIPVKENVEYVQTNNEKSVDDLHFFDKYKKWISVSTYANLNNRPKNTRFIAFNYYKKNIKWVQVEEGTVATPYEPYHTPQSLTLSTPNSLPGIKVDSGGNYTDSDGQQWICDRIVDKNGVIGIEKKINPLEFDGSDDENWIINEAWTTRFDFLYAYIHVPRIKTDIINMMCNRFPTQNKILDYAPTVECFFKDSNETRVVYVSVLKTRLSGLTANDFKKWLQANKLTISYEMDEPTFEPLPQAEQDAIRKLHTNNPTTVISNDESAHMEVTYAADTKNYILNREKAMQKQISDIQAALISQKISGGGIKITDSAKMPLQGLKVFGRSTQDGEPTPENPVPIVSVGDKGNIGISIDGNSQQKLRIETPNGLPGIKVGSGGNCTDSNGQQWICDEIDLERGKYVQRVKKITLNGTETWQRGGLNEGSPDYLKYICKIYGVKLIGAELQASYVGIASSHFKGCSWLCVNFNREAIGISLAYATTESQAGISIFSPKFTTIGELKDWLTKNNVECIAQIETPIEHDITPEEIVSYKALHTEHPTTIFTNDENAEMELTYTVDTKTYVNKKIAEISTAIMQKGN